MLSLRRKLNLAALGASNEEIGQKVAEAAAAVVFSELDTMEVEISGALDVFCDVYFE
jgi:hypothetical protein